jgi:hypothetical protein
MFTSEPTGSLAFVNEPHYLIDTCDQPGLTAGFFIAPNSPIMMRQLRHTAALPVYSVALILSYLSDLIGVIAAKVAGDEWPR